MKFHLSDLCHYHSQTSSCRLPCKLTNKRKKRKRKKGPLNSPHFTPEIDSFLHQVLSYSNRECLILYDIDLNTVTGITSLLHQTSLETAGLLGVKILISLLNSPATIILPSLILHIDPQSTNYASK